MEQRRAEGHRLLRDLAYGMAGGLAGTFVMGRVNRLWAQFEGQKGTTHDEAGRPPFAMVRKISEDVLGIELMEETQQRIGGAAHWGYGLLWGGVYGLLHDRVPALSRAGASPFGVAFTLVGEELVNTVFKLGPPPQKLPAEVHLRALITHLSFAATADMVFRTLRRTVG